MHAIIAIERQKRYNYSFLTPVQGGGEWSGSHLAKGRWYPLGGLQSWSGRFGGVKNILHLPRFKPRIRESIAWSLH